jgi:hypothetical protein
MMVSMRMIKKRDSEYTIGLMVVNMKDGGTRGNSTVLENTQIIQKKV